MEASIPAILSVMSQMIQSSIRPFWPLLLTGTALVFIRFRILPGGWEECGMMPHEMTYWQQGWYLWPDLTEPEAWRGPAETSVLWLVLVGYPVYFLSEGVVIFQSLRLLGYSARAVSRTVLVFITIRLLQGITCFLPLWNAYSKGQNLHSLASACPLLMLLLSALMAGRLASRGFYPFSTFFKGP